MTIHQLHPRGKPMTISWQARLNSAASEAEVIGVARDFLALFNPAEIGCMPLECRPGRFHDAGDVTEYAFTLAKHCGLLEGEAENLVEKLAAFFSHASVRLANLLSSVNQADNDNRESA